jgi:hypothetical protein
MFVVQAHAYHPRSTASPGITPAAFDQLFHRPGQKHTLTWWNAPVRFLRSGFPCLGDKLAGVLVSGWKQTIETCDGSPIGIPAPVPLGRF